MCKVSVERACRLGNFSRGGWYRKSTARDQSKLTLSEYVKSNQVRLLEAAKFYF